MGLIVNIRRRDTSPSRRCLRKKYNNNINIFYHVINNKKFKNENNTKQNLTLKFIVKSQVLKETWPFSKTF